MNKRLILSLLGISLFPVINNNLILESEASNISKTQEDLSPLITYTTERIGDREKMKVTVTVQDRSGSGIKEFRDHNNKLINGSSYTFEISRRGNYTFTAIDNNNTKSSIQINDLWVNPHTNNRDTIYPARINGGATFWNSSNIREWLNSYEEEVSYTCNSPNNLNTNGKGYDKEAGFLSEFTKEERDAISITKHLVWVHDIDYNSISGGSYNPGHFNESMPVTLSSNSNQVLNYKNYKHSVSIDKVYLASPYEIYWFLERRNFSSEKMPTIQAQNKNNKPSNYTEWAVLGGTTGGVDSELSYAVNAKGRIRYASTLYDTGIVPMININPEYKFKDSKYAKDLRIGEYVKFGQYLGESILWQVVNISDTGHVLLLSKDIIDFKCFDAKGDRARLHSDYINYENYDLDLSDDIQYKSTSLDKDVNLPKARLLNEEVLNIRHDKELILELEFLDDDSGIDYIIKPDGNKTTRTSFSYTVFENKEYIFGIMDKAGNFNRFGVPVANINQEASLSINYPTSEWSSKEVDVDIFSDNTIKEVYNISNINSFYGKKLPNYISYANSKFIISGTAKLKSYDPDIYNKRVSLGLGFTYHIHDENDGYTYKASPQWNYGMSKIYVDDLIENNGEIDFKFEVTIPSNYYKDLTPAMQMNFPNGINYNKNIDLVNLTYYLPDDSSFAIKSIELPDGKIIKNVKEYTDTITEDGIHDLTYKVEDNRGIVTKKTITVKVDRTAPTLDLNYNTNTTNQNVTVNISASDSTSGVKRIKLPNGNYITNLNSTYTISGDGEYTFECEDVAGNITTKTITINNIDKEKPNVIIDKNNTDWTNKGVQININARD